MTTPSADEDRVAGSAEQAERLERAEPGGDQDQRRDPRPAEEQDDDERRDEERRR